MNQVHVFIKLNNLFESEKLNDTEIHEKPIILL